MSFAKKKGETIIAAAWNARHMMGLVWKAQVDSQYKCNVFKATVQGALLSGLCAFARNFYGSCTEDELFPLEACHNRLARRLFAMTKRNWDSEPKKGNFEKKKKLFRKFEIVPVAIMIRRRLGRKNGGANSEGRLFPPASAGGNLCADTSGEVPLHDE